MSLSQLAALKAAAKEKPYKLTDGDGLHLLVQPNGSKLWRFRYRYVGRENMLTFGAFPTVSLAAARSKREEARRLLADGTDPAVKRKLDQIAAITAAQIVSERSLRSIWRTCKTAALAKARCGRTAGCSKIWQSHFRAVRLQKSYPRKS
jgi:hypothetical protein